MDRREKIEFLLEQMRLCLAKQDYIRTQIISKKINIKAFEDESAHVRLSFPHPFTPPSPSSLSKDLKLKYYQLMIELDLHEKNYLHVCQHYKHSYETPRIQNDAEQMKTFLKHVVLYLTLSPFDNEQSDLLHRIFLDKNLDEIPKYKFVSRLSPSSLQICRLPLQGTSAEIQDARVDPLEGDREELRERLEIGNERGTSHPSLRLHRTRQTMLDRLQGPGGRTCASRLPSSLRLSHLVRSFVVEHANHGEVLHSRSNGEDGGVARPDGGRGGAVLVDSGVEQDDRGEDRPSVSHHHLRAEEIAAGYSQPVVEQLELADEHHQQDMPSDQQGRNRARRQSLTERRTIQWTKPDSLSLPLSPLFC